MAYVVLPYVIGIVIAITVALFGRVTGFDQQRVFYATVLVVVAHYYGLFGVMGGSVPALGFECIFMAGFVILAVVGFKYSGWLIAAGLVGHGVFDLFHGHLVADPGVPPYWPAFCMTFDVVAGAILAWFLWSKKIAVKN